MTLRLTRQTCLGETRENVFNPGFFFLGLASRTKISRESTAGAGSLMADKSYA